MICRVTYFSEMEFAKDSQLHIEDDVAVGDEIYLTHKYKVKVDGIIKNGRDLTVVDGNKILKLQVV